MTDEVMTSSIVEVEKLKPKGKVTLVKRFRWLLGSVNKSAERRKMSLIWIVLVIISSLTWTVYNAMNFQTSMQLNTSAMSKQYKLESDIQQLLDRWQNTNQVHIESKLKEARSRIFSDYSSLADWLYLLTKNAKLEGISLNYKFGVETELTSLSDLISIPLELEAFAHDEADAYSIYFKLIEFIKVLISEPKHEELLQAEIENKGANKARLSLLINVWMWKPESFDSQKTNTPSSSIHEVGEDGP